MKRLVWTCLFAVGLMAGPGLAQTAKPDGVGDYSKFIKHARAKKYKHSLSKITGPDALVREGRSAQRIEVRPGDCGKDDCRDDRERFELWDKSGIKPGTEGWYSWSMRLQEDFPYVRPSSTILGQFKQEPNADELVGIGIENKQLFFYSKLRRSNGDMRYNIDKPFMPLAQARGRWIDVMVHSNWRPDAAGFMRVFINGKQIANYNGPVTYGLKDKVTFRYGIYRSFVSRYQRKTGGPVPTMVVIYDNVRSGKTRAEVEAR